jgi:hypothetical protein
MIIASYFDITGLQFAALEHDPENWKPAFGKDHALPNK